MFSINQKLTAVIELTIDRELLIKRIIGRYSCNSCGISYHNNDNVSMCSCGSTSFSRRKDDNEITIKSRFKEYDEKTKPISSIYENRNILYTVDGMKEVNKVTSSIMEILQ